MRRLIEDQRSRFFLELLETRAPPCRLRRQKALENETIRGQPRCRQRSDQGTGTGQRYHSNTRRTRLPDQVVARIGNQRRTGIGDQCHILTRLQAAEEAAALIPLVVLMAGRQGRGDPEMLQQARRMPGIFRGDQTHLRQYPQRPRTDVFQIADGRGDHEEGAGDGIHDILHSHIGYLEHGKCAL